jgi:hypothetical protein
MRRETRAAILAQIMASEIPRLTQKWRGHFPDGSDTDIAGYVRQDMVMVLSMAHKAKQACASNCPIKQQGFIAERFVEAQYTPQVALWAAEQIVYL